MSLDRGGNRDAERLSDLPNITELVSTKAKTFTQAMQAWNLHLSNTRRIYLDTSFIDHSMFEGWVCSICSCDHLVISPLALTWLPWNEDPGRCILGTLCQWC
jgi:hypothetical protein